MSYNEFSHEYRPIPRRGFTSLEAAEFLKKEYPDVPEWTCWYASITYRGHQLCKIVGIKNQPSGQIGEWSWSRVPCSYPNITFWEDDLSSPNESCQWVGALRIRGPRGEDFLLFSFMNSTGAIGEWYFVSTRDPDLLDRFAEAVTQHFVVKVDKIRIAVFGGPDVEIDYVGAETVFLPKEFRRDIEQQVFSFFENADAYRRLGLRYRRGFLFVGRPGTGKTMFLRHLIRQCHARYEAAFLMLNIRRETCEFEVGRFFFEATKQAPSVAIIEDMDSIATESKVSRANLLSHLDGLGGKEGVLVIGTTNNPQDVDPALIHRPSRFDRVWHFELPNCEMRLKYLIWAFGGMDKQTLFQIAEQTAGWSFAYLNELRTTAAILCIGQKLSSIREDELQAAFELLASQFHAGRKNHVVSEPCEAMGFSTVGKN